MTVLANLGWKTIAGAGLYALGQVLPQVCPELAPYGPDVAAAGAVLGGVGVAHKGAKILVAAKALLEALSAVLAVVRAVRESDPAGQAVPPQGENQEGR